MPPMPLAPMTRMRGVGFIPAGCTAFWGNSPKGLEFRKPMQITFWGVRGSYPVPGAATVRYGGQTSCVEARTALGEGVIVRAGTGLRALGNKLVPEAKTPPPPHHPLPPPLPSDPLPAPPFLPPASIPPPPTT